LNNTEEKMKRLLLIAFLLAFIPLKGEIKNDSKDKSRANELNYTLSQNYPNPFNPETNVKISIDRDEFVTLKIYNIIGQEVKTVIAEDLAKGEHTIRINAGDLSGGVYFYTLRAGSYTKTMRMTLLK
jgi:hypothetical protein